MTFDVEFEEVTNEFDAEFESSNNEFGVEFESTVAVAGGLTEEVKQALLELFQHLAYTDADGQEYYDALYDAFYPPRELSNIIAVYTQSGSVYPDTPLNDLKNDLVVTARYSDGTTEEVTDYTLSGTLTAGTSVVTVTYEDKTTTFNVTVSEPAVLSSITAVYTQSGTVYDTDSLDSLKADLVVTAVYSDSSTEVVPSTDYTLSGTLAAGTSTITVSYGGKTTTFNVTVTHIISGWLYHFNQSLASSGTEDFGLEGTGVYDTGLFDSYCYSHIIPTSGTASSDTQYGLKALALTNPPDFSGDFTVSFWMATQVNYYCHPVSYQRYANGSTLSGYFTDTTAVKTGWTVSTYSATGKYAGLTATGATAGYVALIIQSANATKGGQFRIHGPSGIDTTTWHHYAFTRKGTTVRFFFDGELIATATTADTSVYAAGQIAISSNFTQTSADYNVIQQMPNGEKMQDLYIAETCKWESDFDPTSIVY